MLPYVRLTYLPAGAKRRRTVWAEQASPRAYWVCNREGARPEPQVLVLVSGKEPELQVAPALMSKHYAMLFVEGDPEFR